MFSYYAISFAKDFQAFLELNPIKSLKVQKKKFRSFPVLHLQRFDRNLRVALENWIVLSYYPNRYKIVRPKMFFYSLLRRAATSAVLAMQVILAMDTVDVFLETSAMQASAIAISMQLALRMDLGATHAR